MPAGATDPDKDAALIEDGQTGKVLYARNETALRHPASLTKMMTLYLLFDALRGRRITMDTPMPVSVHAAQQKPTKLSLRPGQTINVETAIRAIVIRSANDVAVVIAEALGGTESHFAEMMTAKARQLGMKDTNYHNASGLPDPLQITTATDLAILARHVAYDYPQYFPYFGTAGFTYKGVYYPTHDNLIGRYQGADGIKTGYTGASGFNLASSVVRNGVHIVGIVMGGRTAVRRDIEMMHLLDVEFAQIDANPTLVARATVPWAESWPPGRRRQRRRRFADFGPRQRRTSSPPCPPCRRRCPPPTMKTPPNPAARRTRIIPSSMPKRRSWLLRSRPPPRQPPCRLCHPRANAVPAVPPLPANPGALYGAGPGIRPLPRPAWLLSLRCRAGPATMAAAAKSPRRWPKKLPPATALRPDVGEGDVDQPGATFRVTPGRSRLAPLPIPPWPRRSSIPMPARPRMWWARRRASSPPSPAPMVMCSIAPASVFMKNAKPVRSAAN